MTQPGPSGSDEPGGPVTPWQEQNLGDGQWGPTSPRPEQDDGDEPMWGPATPWQERNLGDGQWGPASPRPGQNDDGSLCHTDGMPHNSEDVHTIGGFPQGDQVLPGVDSEARAVVLSVDEGVAGGPAEDPNLHFDSQARLSQPLASRHSAHPSLPALWEDTCGFLKSRYGFTQVSPDIDVSKPDEWCSVLGVKGISPSEDLVRLYDSVRQGAWPKIVCDLSPDNITSSVFPGLPPGMAAEFCPILKAYIITPGPATDDGWKLLVRDPLTVVQIRRLGWGCSGLIAGFVKSGVPFQILHPQKLEGERFHSHAGPVTHPAGKEPTHADYLAYRQELAGFFAHHQHAYAAAVCAGGILWRVATDVLPLPGEADITRPFHSAGCISVAVRGKTYWSPRLTSLEEELVIGLYRWAACELDIGLPRRSLTHIAQLQETAPRMNAGGQRSQPGRDPASTSAYGPPLMNTGIARGVPASPVQPWAALGPTNGRA